MVRKNKFIGSSFDEFLNDNNILSEVEAVATKKVLAWQIKREADTKHHYRAYASSSELLVMHTTYPFLCHLVHLK